jgi:heptosyltransferase III
MISVALPDRPRILVVTLRRLGDVLLTTPLLHALHERWPAGRVETLVFRGTDAILRGNRDLDAVLTIPQRPTVRDLAALLARIWRRYDLAICTQTGDRPVFLTWAAGKCRVGFDGRGETGSWWKSPLFHHCVPVDAENHRVTELMRLAECLGLTGAPRVVCPCGSPPVDLPGSPYAVVHATPMFRYRRWTDDGWRHLVWALAQRGLVVVATGGPDPAERAYLDTVFGPVTPPLLRLDGRLEWPQLAALLSGAAVYVGPDTSMTHLAAASGCPTVGLYGPASPRRIGPWPADGMAAPWEHAGTIQRRGNVWVVQHPLACLPCERVGCQHHVDSFSRCLDELAPGEVLAAVDAALASRPFSGHR